MDCKACGNGTIWFLDLGHHPPSDSFLTNEQLNEPETYYPLNVHVCSSCGLVQLGYIVDKNILFNDKYPYLTGSNKDGVKHYHNLAKEVYDRFKLSKNDLVVDVGSNDGTLLRGFKDLGCLVMGVEPCSNLSNYALESGIPTACTWFSSHKTDYLLFKPRVITACNVFAHVEDTNDFIATVAKILSKDGVFIIESPYLLDMVDGLAYDTIYHEHIYYWSYIPLEKLLAKYGLEVFDMEKQDVHGSTMRYYIGRAGRHDRIRHRVTSVYETEKRFGVDNLIEFSERVVEHRRDLRNLLGRIKARGKKIFGISAPAKGNTLLNYCNIGTETLDYITEINPIKVGKYTPGTHIPVIHESVSVGSEYALILAWNWKDQIIANSKEFIKNGGRFIVPIQDPRIERIGSGLWGVVDGL